jgi:choline dehydrogenase
MLWVRGSRHDYAQWEKAGAVGWGYDDVLPYFRRAEDFEGGEDEFRGVNGPQRVSRTHVRHPLSDAFVDAAIQAGHAFNRDYNGAEQAGVSRAQLSQRRGIRWSTARGFLASAASRPNLTVLTRTQVTSVLVEDGRATGVTAVTRDGARVTLRSRREVVLSAGAIASPALLLRSGIGPRADLDQLGIATVSDAPEVGANLQEHCCASMTYHMGIKSLNQEFNALGFAKHGLDFVLRGRGGATATPCQVILFGDRPGNEGGAADLELMFGPFGVERVSGTDVRSVKIPKTSLVRIVMSALHPRGRGRITLRSADPLAAPKIDRDLYGDPRDLADMVQAVRLTRSIFNAPALRRVTVAETWPGPGAQTDEEIAAALRAYSFGGQHCSGTCRMGDDDDAVVDPRLRVRGVSGLRVADASVMPTVTSGNTNAPTIMIAERAADLITEDAAAPAC